MFLDPSRSPFQKDREDQSEPRLNSQSGSMGLEATGSVRISVTQGVKDKDPGFMPLPVGGSRYYSGLVYSLLLHVDMKHETMRASYVRAAMLSAVPAATLELLIARGLGETISGMAADPKTRADVGAMLAGDGIRAANPYVARCVRAWRHCAALLVIQLVRKADVTPNVFRDWTRLENANEAKGRVVLMFMLQHARLTEKRDGCAALYKHVVFKVVNRQMQGVTARMLNVKAPDLSVNSAQGTAFFAFNRSHMVSADGAPHERVEKRKNCFKQRLCLVVVASRVLRAFVSSSHNFSLACRVGFAHTVRSKISNPVFPWCTRC